MKSYRQNLAIWIDEKISENTDNKILSILMDVKSQIKLMEKEEESMVNKSYDKGYMDGADKRGRQSNYYRTSYKINDTLRDLIRKNS